MVHKNCISIVFLTLAAGGTSPGEARDVQKSLFLSPSLYVPADYETRPVVAKSVTATHPEHAGWVLNEVVVASRLAAVESVRLRWYLSKEGRRKILSQGETPEIMLESPKSEATIRRRVVDRAQLAAKTRNAGNFRIEVEVSAAKFADGTSWRIEPAGREYAVTPRVRRTSGCPWNKCQCSGFPEISPHFSCVSNYNPTECIIYYEGGGNQNCTVRYCGP